MNKKENYYPIIDDEWRKKHPNHPVLLMEAEYKNRKKPVFARLDYLLYTPDGDPEERKEIHYLLTSAFKILLEEAYRQKKVTPKTTIEDFKRSVGL